MTPGSQEAVRAGCTCPRIDNHYGEGSPQPTGARRFAYRGDCPVHGVRAQPDEWRNAQ